MRGEKSRKRLPVSELFNITKCNYKKRIICINTYKDIKIITISVYV